MWSSVTGFFHLAPYAFKASPRCSMHRYSISFYCLITFHCMERSHFIHSSAEGHLACFLSLANMNSALTFPHKLLCGHIFLLLEYTPRIGIAYSYYVQHLEEMPGCVHFTSPPAACENSNSSAPCQLTLCGSDKCPPRGCEVVPHSGLICISLVAGDTEHRFRVQALSFFGYISSKVFGYISSKVSGYL